MADNKEAQTFKEYIEILGSHASLVFDYDIKQMTEAVFPVLQTEEPNKEE